MYHIVTCHIVTVLPIHSPKPERIIIYVIDDLFDTVISLHFDCKEAITLHHINVSLPNAVPVQLHH